MKVKDNAFDKLWEDRELPESAKKDVIGNLESFKLLLELIDLFTIKNVKANLDMIGAIAEINSKQNKK